MSPPLACQWCGTKHAHFGAARQHRFECPRLRALGFDLECKVLTGDMAIADAETEQAKRPAVRL